MERKRSYSGLFIINPDKKDDFDAVGKGIKTIISDNAGTIESEKFMGKKPLAYPINKKKEALYYEVNFSADPSSLEKITRLCRINTDILRTLIDKSK